MWGVAGWGAGVLVLLVGLPLAAAGRLPDPVATHWSGDSGAPDGSMGLWAAALFPALVWAVVVAGVAFGIGRAPLRGWALGALGFGGVMLAGTQASIVRANLDAAEWRGAGSLTGWLVAVVIAVALLAGFGAAALGRREAAAEPPPGAGPGAEVPEGEVPEGERPAWMSSASNPWLYLLAGLFALAALGVLLAGLAGLAEGRWQWLTAGSLALGAAAVLLCSSVRVRVTGRGLEVAFGPFGYPVRRWAAEEVESARVEVRGAARVGGWGYRINGLGTTVMLRGGECLVVRAKGRDFAVSVDDAARGAALLDSLTVRKG